MYTYLNHKAFSGKYLNESVDLATNEQEIIKVLSKRLWVPLKTQLVKYCSKLPYHNLNRAIGVTGTAIDLYHSCVINGEIRNFDNDSLKRLVYSALLHDIGHTGGLMDDDKNTTIASEIAKDILSDPIYGLNKLDINVIEYIIKQTTFVDGNYPYETRSIMSMDKILRDADILSTFDNSNAPTMLDGLKTELNYVGNSYEFMQDHLKFISNVEFFTNTAKFKVLHYISTLSGVLIDYGTHSHSK